MSRKKKPQSKTAATPSVKQPYQSPEPVTPRPAPPNQTATGTPRRRPNGWQIACLLLLAVAAFIRFYDLGHTDLRSDELNFLNWSIRKPSISELWKNPPWMDQIPLAESIAILWARVWPHPASEASIRIPFALLGWITVAGLALWAGLRLSWRIAFLLSSFLSLLPYHVLQSREAYYYIVGMTFTAGLTMLTVEQASRLAGGHHLRMSQLAAWLACAVLAGLSHMAMWAFTGMCWLVNSFSGWRGLGEKERKKFMIRWAGVGVIWIIIMLRWIYRALQKILEAQAQEGVLSDTGFIGGALEWVAPRVLPMFLHGYNSIGFGLLLAVLGCGAAVLLQWRKLDLRLRTVSVLALGGIAAVYAYVTIVGRGSAKITYFTSILPVFVLWSAAMVDRALHLHAPRFASWIALMVGAFVTTADARPAWMMTRLEGKPVPYRALRERLDSLLPPGSVAIVDRWFEPWNEMARYLPTNVAVTFTVPDEPLENYMKLQWREVTRKKIESGSIDAFIRLARNHEEKMGLWKWPESWFARSDSVSNAPAYWLRERGFAPDQDYHQRGDARIRVEIFYNTREDAIAKAIHSGRRFPVFFGADLPHEKSGPLGFLRFRTQQFLDWRVLGTTGSFEVINTYSVPYEAVIELSGIAPFASKVVRASTGHAYNFSQGILGAWPIGPVVLLPGTNTIGLRDFQSGGAASPLYISEIRVRHSGRDPDASEPPEK